MTKNTTLFLLVIVGGLVLVLASACEIQSPETQDLTVLLEKGPDNSILTQSREITFGVNYQCDSKSNTCSCTGKADCKTMMDDWIDGKVCDDSLMVCNKEKTVCVCKWR